MLNPELNKNTQTHGRHFAPDFSTQPLGPADLAREENHPSSTQSPATLGWQNALFTKRTQFRPS
jgi:hypothetical protein